MTRPNGEGRGRPARLQEMGVRPSLPQYLAQLWQRREFALIAPLGELRQRNMNTALGSVWHLLNPLFQALIYYALFGVILDTRGGIENYAVWMIVGLITFNYTSKTVASASGIIVQRITMLRTLRFPAGILPLSVTVGELIAHLPAIAVMLAIVLTAYPVSSGWLLVVLVVVLQTLFNLGLGLIVARLTVHFHDFSQLLSHLLKMWLLSSGVLFSFQDAPDGLLRTLLEGNPAYVYIDLTRAALFEGSLSAGRLWEGVIWALGMLLVGLLFFHRHEGRYSSAS